MKVRCLQFANHENRELFWFGVTLMAALLTLTPMAHSQQIQSQQELSASSQTLPDAPEIARVESPAALSSSSSSSSLLAAPMSAMNPMNPMSGSIFAASDPSVPASRYEKYILPGQIAPPLSPSDKVGMGLHDAFSPFSLVGIVVSAGYSHLTNGSPNYGVNSQAFAQRFGAAAARDTSEGLFTDCIMANIFHEDTRYYELGSGHSLVKRVAYAATRVIITRTDSGRTTPNLAMLTGYAGAAALTNVYYPQLNRGFHQNALTFGGALGGTVVGNLVDEFSSGALEWLHIKKAK